MTDVAYSMRKFCRRGMKALLLIRSEQWRNGLKQGVGATIEHDGLPFREHYGAVIDVGAHQGQFALYSRERFPSATLYCFEPLERPRRKLESILGGDRRIHVVAAAAGAAEGTSTIHISQSDDSSSLLSFTPSLMQTFPNTQEVSQTQIPVVTLDNHFRDETLAGPVLLKIDVQGYELEVLKGAVEFLGRVDSVLVECSFRELYEGQPLFDDVYAFLRAAGFALSGGHISHIEDKCWVQGDFLFRRPDLAVSPSTERRAA